MTQKKTLSMTWKILIAVAVGLTVGLVLGEAVAPVQLVGDIFLRLIQMSVVVLIMGAVVEAVATLDPKELGKLGVRVFLWFTVTTLIASAIGLGLGVLLQPGAGVHLEPEGAAVAAQASQSISEIMLEFFPSNIVSAMGQGNMIQVIVFALPFGVALGAGRVKRGGESPLFTLLQEFNQTVLGLVGMVMQLAPLGIAALMAATAASAGLKVILPLAKFLLIFGLGTLLHLALCVGITAVYTRVSPLRIVRGLAGMTIMALTTTSSAITLPTKMKDSEEKLGVSKRISSLVNPLGMTLNSNGLSMYLALACVTVVQIYGMDMDLGAMVRVVLLSSLACLGTVVVPGGGLVALTIIVPGLGLPVESVAILSGIDWFSGMFRTVLNVDIDALIAMAIAKDVGELDRASVGRGQNKD